MSAAPPGSVVSLYYDSPRQVEVGDEIRTPSGRRYEVVRIRYQQRGAHVGRKHIAALVLDPDRPLDPDVKVHPLHWYRR